MFVKKIDQNSEENYKAAALKASVFNQQGWLALYGSDLDRYGLFDDDNKLTGGFFIYRSTAGRVITHYKNPPFTPHIGLFYENPSQNRSNYNTFDKAVLSCIADFLAELPCQLLTIAMPVGINDMQPFVWKNFSVVPNYTYLLDLSLTTEEMYGNFTTDKRNSISKATRDGMTVEVCTDMKLIEKMVSGTYKRKTKKLNESILAQILFKFADSSNSFAFMCRREDEPLAACFCLYYNNTCYYLLGGYSQQGKHQGAGTLALWKCIEHAKSIGLKKFDFEGSMLPEVEKFFRGFGGDLVPYYTINRAVAPLNRALKFVKPHQF